MKTSYIYFRSSNDSFVYPCFDTSLSRCQIIASILSCPSLLGNRDVLSYQFRFVGPYRVDKPRSKSAVYCVDVDALDKTSLVVLVPIPIKDSLFHSHSALCSRNK